MMTARGPAPPQRGREPPRQVSVHRAGDGVEDGGDDGDEDDVGDEGDDLMADEAMAAFLESRGRPPSPSKPVFRQKSTAEHTPHPPAASAAPPASAPPAPADPFTEMWSVLSARHLPRLEGDQPLSTLVSECDEVWRLISQVDFSEKKSERNRLLRALFRLVDRQTDPGLYMKICRISLRLASPGGQTLLNTTKLLFKLSKSEGNDARFLKEGLVEPILAVIEDPGNNQFELLLYAVGTLKNISGNEGVQKFLSQQAGIPVLAGVLAQFPPDAPEGDKRAQLLVQATATLRNLAGIGPNKTQFVKFGVIEKLLRIVAQQATYGELQLNVVRILSKLSLFEECRRAITQDHSAVGALFNLLTLHGRTAALVIRVCFILGNVTSRNEAVRLMIADEHDGINTLLGLLFDYSLVDEGIADEGAKQDPSLVDGEVSSHSRAYRMRETEDVLTKLVRLIAHLAISEELGPRIARDDGIMPLVSLLERKSIDKSEELVLNIVSAVTNLSFYDTPDNHLLHVQKRLMKALTPLLLHANEDALIEASRSFGNFSRSQESRAYLASKRVNEMLAILLDHANRDVVAAVCGVLMNLCGDPSQKATLLDCQVAEKLAEVARMSGGVTDVELTLVTFKTIYNLCLDTPHRVLTDRTLEEMVQSVTATLTAAQNEIQKNKKAARRKGEDDASVDQLEDVVEVSKAVLESLSNQKSLPPAPALVKEKKEAAV